VGEELYTKHYIVKMGGTEDIKSQFYFLLPMCGLGKRKSKGTVINLCMYVCIC
jgi:hypothetical protein